MEIAHFLSFGFDVFFCCCFLPNALFPYPFPRIRSRHSTYRFAVTRYKPIIIVFFRFRSRHHCVSRFSLVHECLRWLLCICARLAVPKCSQNTCYYLLGAMTLFRTKNALFVYCKFMVGWLAVVVLVAALFMLAMWSDQTISIQISMLMS